MVPVGMTPAPEYQENGMISQAQANLFVYKARECKSAPVRTKDMIPDVENGLSRDSSGIAKKKLGTNKLISWGKITQFFVGNAPEFTSWASSYSSQIPYYTIFAIETLLRSIGSIAFCSNPFSGLLMLIGMLISCPHVTFLAIVTVASGLITATAFLKIPTNDIRGGVVLFNNYLVGTVIAMVAEDDVLWKAPEIVGVCMIMGILTVIIWKGLNGILASHLEFPLLNAPFHIILLLYIFSGIASRYKAEDSLEIHAVTELPLPISLGNATNVNVLQDSFNKSDVFHMYGNGTSQMYLAETPSLPSSANSLPGSPDVKNIMNVNVSEPFDWTKMLSGILLAPSQVWGTESIATSMLVYTAIFLYSPIMFLQSATGAAIGTLIGTVLCTSAEYNTIYDGSWGYNPLFTTAALGGFFVIFNTYSWLISISGSIITTLLYSAMIKCHVPALGIPFMLATWLLLPSIPILKESCPDDYRPVGPFYRLRLFQLTTPEQHRNLLPEDEGSDPNNKYKSERTPSSMVQPLQPGNSILPL